VFERSRVSRIDGSQLSLLVGASALALWACTPLNAPTEAGADRPSNQDASPDTSATDTSADTSAADKSADTSAADKSADTSASDTFADTSTTDAAPDQPRDATDGPVDTPGDTPVDTPGDTSSGTGCTRFTRGPAMVMAPTPTRMICIDATEVTQAQYQQFLDAAKGSTTGQNPECDWNVRFAPDLMCMFDPTGHGAYPVNGVDWCDATAYCRWAGKRLCGGSTGGHIDTAAKSDLLKAEISEWTAVCTHGGDRTYPYGTVFDGQACNGGESMTPTAIVPVGTTPGCEGGYPGVFDMVGNVHEWEDACYATGGPTGQTDMCWFRGGSYHDLGDACTMAFDLRRDYVDYLCDIGFRCCADP
jgi:hypothetical protein